MISYDLSCSDGHRFEGWFASSAEYDAQLTGGLLQCPVCGDAQISKLLTAPNVGRKGNQVPKKMATGTPQEISKPENVPSAQPVINNDPLPPAIAEIAQKMAEVQKEMLKESHWVGRGFAEEARAIHYGETDARLIHGETSPDEAEELTKEGIKVAPLLFPFIPPEVKN